jgi:hypothetical protein
MLGQQALNPKDMQFQGVGKDESNLEDFLKFVKLEFTLLPVN